MSCVEERGEESGVAGARAANAATRVPASVAASPWKTPFGRSRSTPVAVVRQRSSTALHTKERCHGCGMWKSKSSSCAHCATRPNRAQAKAAQARHVPNEMTPIGIGRAGVDAVVMPREVWPRGFGGPPSSIHTKERCHGCGMWKSKSRPCTHCTSRPNRAQARVSQEREYASQRPP